MTLVWVPPLSLSEQTMLFLRERSTLSTSQQAALWHLPEEAYLALVAQATAKRDQKETLLPETVPESCRSLARMGRI